MLNSAKKIFVIRFFSKYSRLDLEHGAIGGQERGDLRVRGLHLLLILGLGLGAEVVVDAVQDLPLLLLQQL